MTATTEHENHPYGAETGKPLYDKNPYYDNRRRAAGVLCAMGYGEAVYITQYSSGATAWNLSLPDAQINLLVRADGSWYTL